MTILYQNRLAKVFKEILGLEIQEKDYSTIYLNLLEANLKDIDLGKFKDNEKYANEDYIYLTIFNAVTGMSAELGNDLLNHLMEKELKSSVDMRERVDFMILQNKNSKRKPRLVPNKTTYLSKIRRLKIQNIQKMIDNSIDRFIKRLMKIKGLKQKIILAFDFTEEEYYGKLIDKYVVKGKYKNGTNKFFKFLTCNICIEGQRFTIGFQVWKKGLSMAKYMKKMLEKVKELGFKIELVTMDRGFYSQEIFWMLDKQGLKFLVPAKMYEPIKKKVIAYFWKKGKRITTHVIGSNGKFFTGKLIIYPKERKISEIRRECRKNGADTKEILKHFFVFFTNSPLTRFDLWVKKYDKKIPGFYKKRWGIETSYRVKNEFIIPTCSRSSSIRAFYFGFKVILYNNWVLLNFLLVLAKSCSKRKNHQPVKLFKWDLKEFLLLKLKSILLVRGWIKIPLNQNLSKLEVVKNFT